MCKIAIVENYTLFGSELKMLLSETDEFEVTGEATNVKDLVRSLGNRIPDIIIVDILHCHNAGIKLLEKIRHYYAKVPVLLITSEDYTDCFSDYLSCGVKGFVYKEDSYEDLIHAIRKVCMGKVHFRKQIKNNLSDFSHSPGPGKHIRKKKHTLTERETTLLKLFCDGLTFKEIGIKLFISPRTVETHKKNIMAKLNVNSTAEMVRYATRHKLTNS